MADVTDMRSCFVRVMGRSLMSEGRLGLVGDTVREQKRYLGVRVGIIGALDSDITGIIS